MLACASLCQPVVSSWRVAGGRGIAPELGRSWLGLAAAARDKAEEGSADAEGGELSVSVIEQDGYHAPEYASVRCATLDRDVMAYPVTWMERSWRWCKRKPAVAAVAAAAARK